MPKVGQEHYAKWKGFYVSTKGGNKDFCIPGTPGIVQGLADPTPGSWQNMPGGMGKGMAPTTGKRRLYRVMPVYMDVKDPESCIWNVRYTIDNYEKAVAWEKDLEATGEPSPYRQFNFF